MMDHRRIKTGRAGRSKSPNKFTNDAGERVTLEYCKSKSSSLISSSFPPERRQLYLRIKQFHGQRGNKKLVPRSDCQISKRITSFDNQYLSHCLELIQIGVPKAASFNIPVTWSPSKTSCSTDSFPSSGNVSIGASLPDGSGDLGVFSPSKTSISEARGKSMIDILRSPLFIHGGFSVFRSPLAEKKPENREREVLNRNTSQYKSSNLSTSPDLSSCSSTDVSHGIFQCTLSNGIPHFMFSMDKKPEVYVTRPSKSASSDRDSMDWTYLLRRSSSNQKDSDLVGRMNVSTRLQICADSSKIMETKFVLYGNNENLQELEQDSSCHEMRKQQMVSKFYKPPWLLRHVYKTNNRGKSTQIELAPSKLELDDDGDFDHIGSPNLLENNIAPNFELAAIIIKEQIQVLQQETEVSGWGMSFLKRAKEKEATNCHQSTTETSMDILVPAGYHGGPKAQNGGPSSLLERWRSGQCDCGGWDTGCPVTILSTRPNKHQLNPGSQGLEARSVNIFLQGDKEGHAPSMKLVSMQKGLYYIDFQSRLSALQCFSIAVALIHNRSPTLRPQAQIV